MSTVRIMRPDCVPSISHSSLGRMVPSSRKALQGVGAIHRSMQSQLNTTITTSAQPTAALRGHHSPDPAEGAVPTSWEAPGKQTSLLCGLGDTATPTLLFSSTRVLPIAV